MVCESCAHSPHSGNDGKTDALAVGKYKLKKRTAMDRVRLIWFIAKQYSEYEENSWKKY